MNVRTFIKQTLLLVAGVVCTVGVWAQPQGRSVQGVVRDADDNQPLPGVSVVVTGTTRGTITDVDGKFSIATEPGETLTFSFIGYESQELSASPNMSISLAPDVQSLEDVVVIGYGQVKKEDMTGSVTAIKPDEISKGLTTSAQDMIAGKIAGVNVTSNSGEPGAGSQIRIRGGSSLNASNDPLIVIDGLAIDNEGIKGMANGLAMVNPEDIETFTVLKDASATAIYGSRASNGVIIITTKKGSKSGKLQIAYAGNVSVATTQKRYDVMSGDEFRAYVAERYGSLDDAPAELGDADTDWQDEIFRVAVSHDHHISLNGQIAKVLPFRFSVGYTGQEGIIETSSMKRFTTSLNLSPSLFNDHFKINFTAKYMYGKSRYADSGSAIGAALNADPTQSVYMDCEATGGYWQYLTTSADAEWTGQVTNSNAVQNPLALLELENNTAKSHDFTGNIDLDYKLHFFPDMHVHATFGGEYAEGRQEDVISPYSFSNNYYGWDGVETQYKYNLSYNLYLQYLKELGKHTIDIMAGGEEQHFHRNGSSYGQGTDPSTGEAYNESLWSENAYATRNTLVSFFGRLNYNYASKYLITATFRADGSSRFADGNRWGYFPSVALGWKIKEESFLVDNGVVSDLKLRLGWGITGQQDIDSDFGYTPLYTTSNSYAQYAFGDTYYYTSRPNAYNEDLEWEETTTYNVGIDYGFLSGRITGSVDGYYRETENLLNTVKIPVGTNFNSQLTSNIGSLENYGVEFSINAKPIARPDFLWDVTYNVTWNHNEITELSGGSDDDDYYVETGSSISPGNNTTVQVHKVGAAASSYYVYQQVYDESGKPLEGVFVDRNGDGIINSSDKYLYKKPAPDVTMGFTSKFVYKHWDFSFSLRASFNNYVYYDYLADKARVGGSYLYSNSAYHNSSSEAVELGFTGLTDYYMSDFFVRNGSFLRCDNINLGYSFNNLLKGASYSGINGRVYLTCQNPFIISDYDGMDPEVADGIDSNPYPRAVTFLLGLNLQF